MIAMILTIALLGVIVWAITTYVPMPPAFKTAILVIAFVFLLLYILAAFGMLGEGLYVPRIRTGP